MWCIINLPNGTQQAVQWDSKANGQDCLEKVCQSLDIVCEMEYFGLEHWSPEKQSCTPQWINLRNRLSFDNNAGIPLMLALRVKFWVPVHFLLQESVRNLFYMQAKADLIEGRLCARDWTNAAKLSALLCQADGICFNEASLLEVFPIRLEKERKTILQKKQQHKELKEKEYVLSLKKRRLSKQKSLDNIESCHSTILKPKIYHTCTLSEIPSNTLSVAQARLGSTINNNDYENLNNNIKNKSVPSLLSIYQNYFVHPADSFNYPIPDDFFNKIAAEHGKFALLKMSQKSAKYWLLQEIQDLPMYGKEVFSGITTGENSSRCDILVDAYGITFNKGISKEKIRFNAISAAKSFRRTFKLEYLDDLNECSEIEIKLPRHALAAALYRSITERHAFYVCDKVRGVVTNQFTRDLKGTIASMFKEDTELGKRYVFDIQHTCREVHDQARRFLHERGLQTGTLDANADDFRNILQYLPQSISIEDKKTTRACVSDDYHEVIREKQKYELFIESCVETRISEAMTCKICMDNQINSMFNPCCHIMACMDCAARCINCPNCRVKVISFMKIFLPTELRAKVLHKNGNTVERSLTDLSPTTPVFAT